MGVPYEYPELRLLPTVQGVVVSPAIDTLRVRPLRQGVELTSGAGLQVTPVSREMAATNTLAAGGPITTIFDFERWRALAPAAFEAQKQKLLKTAASTKELEREKARFDLAAFFLARGFAAEALGVLDTWRPAVPASSKMRVSGDARGSRLPDGPPGRGRGGLVSLQSQ
jgi:hypothetical protein